MARKTGTPQVLSQLLFDEPPLVVSPSLAAAVGIDAAHFLQQIHYWLERSNNICDGRRWVYHTYEEWREQFPWMSVTTLSRLTKRLVEDGLLITGCYNEMGRDRTTWYTINYEQLTNLAQSAKVKNASRQNEKCNPPKCEVATCQNDVLQATILEAPLPENTTETTTENTILSSLAKSQEKLTTDNQTSSILITKETKKTKEPKPEKPKEPRTLEQIIASYGEDSVNRCLKEIEIAYGSEIPYFAKQLGHAGPIVKKYGWETVLECWKFLSERQNNCWVELSWVVSKIADFVAGRLPGQKGQNNGRTEARRPRTPDYSGEPFAATKQLLGLATAKTD